MQHWDIPDMQPVILDNAIIERDFGWVFFYQSDRFLATDDMSYALVGNAPIIVNKYEGSVYVTGTADPVEVYIRSYEKTGDPYSHHRPPAGRGLVRDALRRRLPAGCVTGQVLVVLLLLLLGLGEVLGLKTLTIVIFYWVYFLPLLCLWPLALALMAFLAYKDAPQ